MAYAPSPAIPPGLDPSDWRSMIEAVEVEARALLSAGVDPLAPHPGVGRASRYRTLAATLERLGLKAAEASVGSKVLTDYYAPALVKAHAALVEVQAAHGMAAQAELAAFLTNAGVPVVPNVGALEATVARTTQAITHDWQRLASSTQSGVVDALRGSMVGGRNPTVAARAIAHTGELAYSRGLNIARTEMADLYSASRLDYMSRTDAITGWWWRAKSDACPICQALHGEVFATDSPRLAHHSCNCVMVPIVGGYNRPEPTRSGDAIYRNSRPPIPKSWPRGLSRDDFRGLVTARDNPGWRPSYRMVKPAVST